MPSYARLRLVHTIPFSLLFVLTILERYTHDVIALAAFGFDADSVQATEDRPSVSFEAMRMIALRGPAVDVSSRASGHS